MGMPPARTVRDQSRSEELANSLSHGAGLVASLAAAPFLIARAVHHGDKGYIVGAAVFAAATILLYSSSTLYHALRPGKFKRIVRTVEHSAIFFMIAGTYTPFTLGILRDSWGWPLFGVIWGLALIGILLKILDGAAHVLAFTGLYLFMGWLIVVAARPLYDHLPAPGLMWLIAGGVAYTTGVAFFTTDSRLRYGHLIWHLFVLAGTGCHYLAVLWYVV